MKEKIKIGIMGGTFNPIHYGHLVAAAEALNQFKLDKVVFIPTGDSPHKNMQEENIAEHRYLMTVIAIASNKHFFVSRIEIDRKGISYTIDTLKELKMIYGKDADLFFITGADAVLEILNWKKPQEVIKLCSFIAATRPGYDLSKIEEIKEIINLKTKDDSCRIYVITVPALAISSTDIRKRVKEERPINYLTPEGVCNYILKHGLYK